VAPTQQADEAEFVIETSRGGKTPMAAGVISGRLTSPGFEAYARRFHGSPYIKGVRELLQGPEYPKGFCLQPAFLKSVRLLGELGLSFDICMRAEELADGARLADACPDTRFVLDHCGNASVQWADRSQWERDMTEIGKRKNVVGKVSGVIKSCKPGQNKAEAIEPYVRHTLQAFGPDRVMFASDWPVCTLGASLREWVEALQQIVRGAPLEERRKLFHDNAARFYGLA
jgi:predicted TIM-barrel fold metal-dependent hydrolase